MDYTTIALGYNELYKEEQEKKIKILLEQLTIKKEWLIADIGAGTGFVEKILPCTVLNIEPNPAMLEQAHGIKIQARAEQLPLKEKSVDGITCITAIHHCNYQKAIAEMQRILKSTGFIFITLLKKAKQAEEIKSFLKRFNPIIIEEEKDWCFLIKNTESI